MSFPTPQDKAAIAHRRTVVADRYLRRQTMMTIAAALEVSVGTIHSDLQSINAAWRKSAMDDIGKRKAEELARIDRLEAENWRAWEKSQEPKQSKRRARGFHTGKDPSTKGEVVIENVKRDGDPRFLQGIAWCIERRCKLLGLDPKTENTSSGAAPVVIQIWEREVIRDVSGEIIDAPRDQGEPSSRQLPPLNGQV